MKKKESAYGRTWHNIVQILRLQHKISKTPLALEIFIGVTEKGHRIAEIIFPALVIDLLTVDGQWNPALAVIFTFSTLLALLDFAVQRARDSLTAHAERTDNYVLLTVNQKSMRMDFQNILSADGMDAEQKGTYAISEFLELDYILFHEILGALLSLGTLGYLVSQVNVVALTVVLAAALIHYFLERRRVMTEHSYEEEKAGVRRKKQYMEELLFDLRCGKDIRVYDGADFIRKQFLSVADGETQISRRQRKHHNLFQALERTVQLFQVAVLYGFAVLKYMGGGITIGSFTVYLRTAEEISNSLKQLLDAVAELVRVNVYFKDYDAFMRLPQQIGTSSPAVDLEGDNMANQIFIAFERVSFRYPESQQDALHEVSFYIRSGETLSIVGENGAGKTTLVYLLLRLFEPTSGVITLNGKDIRQYPYEEYRRLVAPVFQDYELLSYSLRENVVFDLSVDEKRLEDCYRAANLWEKITAFPHGDQTIMTKELYEDGEELSGGEKQKLSIARAYYHGGNVLILDEPTAALDPVSEHAIYQNIAMYYQELNERNITIFITHRLSSTLFSNRILVLDGGEVAELGTHEELMKRGGLYREMFDKQAFYYKKQESEGLKE